jgi:hypothetical protein
MPDGAALLAGKVKVGGGKSNYCWIVFRNGGRRGAEATIDWGLPRYSGAEVETL